MITSIELGDFLSHSETKLEFDNGVTVFVGHNGAGKSSIIDAITFSLFGNHTRKSNKGLIRRGSNQGYAKIGFSVNGRHYQTVRKVDSKGGIVAKFSEIVNGETIEIAAGERKQFGESMTHEIERTIGLNFEKLKIASIVQQGELNSIIKAKPKEFKELLNAIIGIDKLDIASESMKAANKGFREKIREDIGYDDTHIDILQRELGKHQKELEEAAPKKEDLISKQTQLQEELSKLNTRLERDAPKSEKINTLRQRKRELQDYAKEAIQQIQREIAEKERKIKECKECFEHVELKKGLESKIENVELAIQETQKRIKELTASAASLREKESLAAKLQLENNRCPVCGSRVEELNPLFQQEHLAQELKSVQQRIAAAEGEHTLYNQKKGDFSSKLQIVREAETTLRIHAVNSKEDIITMQEEINVKRQNVQNIPSLTSENLLEISAIDSHAGRIFDEIRKLESEIGRFDEKEFQDLKNDINEKRNMLSYFDRQIGAISEKICRSTEQVEAIQKAIKELKVVKEYVNGLEDIQENIFSRDGPVATSLRSWALNAISDKASEYLALLNTKIQRMQLSEKSRDVSIMCYSKTEMLDIESLSGGEQVSVALALRLGMASLLGASNLNLMILDEPTTHLDAERKKSLVGVLSQLSDIANSKTPMQFIIITHDAEIFEDSTVEKIYRFESAERGSRVTAL